MFTHNQYTINNYDDDDVRPNRRHLLRSMIDEMLSQMIISLGLLLENINSITVNVLNQCKVEVARQNVNIFV